MKHRLAALLLISLLTTTASMAQEGFNGTWKLDDQSAMSSKAKTMAPPYLIASLKAFGPYYPRHRRVNSAGRVHGFATPREANWSRFSFYSVRFPFRQPNDISVANSAFTVPSTTKSE
jgi:hypothetical protein